MPLKPTIKPRRRSYGKNEEEDFVQGPQKRSLPSKKLLLAIFPFLSFLLMYLGYAMRLGYGPAGTLMEFFSGSIEAAFSNPYASSENVHGLLDLGILPVVFIASLFLTIGLIALIRKIRKDPAPTGGRLFIQALFLYFPACIFNAFFSILLLFFLRNAVHVSVTIDLLPLISNSFIYLTSLIANPPAFLSQVLYILSIGVVLSFRNQTAEADDVETEEETNDSPLPEPLDEAEKDESPAPSDELPLPEPNNTEEVRGEKRDKFAKLMRLGRSTKNASAVITDPDAGERRQKREETEGMKQNNADEATPQSEETPQHPTAPTEREHHEDAAADAVAVTAPRDIPEEIATPDAPAEKEHDIPVTDADFEPRDDVAPKQPEPLSRKPQRTSEAETPQRHDSRDEPPHRPQGKDSTGPSSLPTQARDLSYDESRRNAPLAEAPGVGRLPSPSFIRLLRRLAAPFSNPASEERFRSFITRTYKDKGKKLYVDYKALQLFATDLSLYRICNPKNERQSITGALTGRLEKTYENEGEQFAEALMSRWHFYAPYAADISRTQDMDDIAHILAEAFSQAIRETGVDPNATADSLGLEFRHLALLDYTSIFKNTINAYKDYKGIYVADCER